MATAKSKRTVTAEVPNVVVDALDARATQEGRSRNEVINRALAFFLEYAETEVSEPTVPIPKLRKKTKTE